MVFLKYLVSSYLCAYVHTGAHGDECVGAAGAGTTSSCEPPDAAAES